MSKKHHVLLVEDELNFGSVLSQFLSMHGFEVTWAKQGAKAWSIIQTGEAFDCCVLDVMMPEMDGFTLGKEIKQRRPELPFVFLTARSMKEDMIQGFKIGAVDYITKPFDSEVLVYKIKALLERSVKPKQTETVFQIGQFEFDSELRQLRLDEEVKNLSPKEGALLKLLAERANSLVSREELVATSWNEDNYFTRRSMDVYMSKLRKYLEADPSVSITSVHAGGYRLESPISG